MRVAPRFDHDDDREGDDDERQQEVGHDGERMQIEDHGHAAERDLRHASQEGTQRSPSRESGSPCVLREASHVTSAKRIPIAATTRLPNSTNAWNPSSGYGVSPQRGQFSHPSPEPVSRTNAPDVTTTNIAPSENAASLRKRRADTSPWRHERRVASTALA